MYLTRGLTMVTGMLRRSVVLGGGLVVVLSGCAFMDMKVPLPKAPTTNYEGGDNRVIVVPVFKDNRFIKTRIGMKKNNYGQDTASALPDEDVVRWLTDRVAAELRYAGFKVSIDAEKTEGTKLQGYLEMLFIEPVIQWTTVDVETDLGVRLEVIRPDGLEAERRYYVKGIQQGVLVTDNDYAVSLSRTADQLMKRLVPDVINLLNRVPENKGQP